MPENPGAVNLLFEILFSGAGNNFLTPAGL